MHKWKQHFLVLQRCIAFMQDVCSMTDVTFVQSATQEVLSGDWPVVIHILAHLYNGRL